MSTITTDIVAKLWNLCNVLKDDGVTSHQYVTELTYLLFLKMAKGTGAEDAIPTGHRWDDLKAMPAPNRLGAGMAFRSSQRWPVGMASSAPVPLAILRNSKYVSSVTYWWEVTPSSLRTLQRFQSLATMSVVMVLMGGFRPPQR